MTFIRLVLYQERLKGIAVLFVKSILLFVVPTAVEVKLLL